MTIDFPGFASKTLTLAVRGPYTLTAIANTILLLNATSSSNYTTDSGLNNLTITNGNTTYSISSPLPYNIYTASRLLSTGTLQLGGYFDEVTSF